jgi:hypothetical protein
MKILVCFKTKSICFPYAKNNKSDGRITGNPSNKDLKENKSSKRSIKYRAKGKNKSNYQGSL